VPTDTLQTVLVPQAPLYALCHGRRHYPNCTGATASSTVSTVPPTQTLSKLYRCHSKLYCMHSATDTDTLQTVPVPQQALLYAQCHRHRHSPNCTGATACSTVCTVPPTQTLSKLYRCHSKLYCMHSATDTDTLQTVPLPKAPLYARCHRQRHSPNCTGATSSTVCTVPPTQSVS